jgi:hypothetical protein
VLGKVSVGLVTESGHEPSEYSLADGARTTTELRRGDLGVSVRLLQRSAYRSSTGSSP